VFRLGSRVKRLLKGEMPFQYVVYKIITSRKLPSLSLAKLYGKCFKKSNLSNEYTIQEVDIHTYDGFNQATHPDICEFNGRIYMVVTPYAYCDERLENPCVYVLNTENDLKAEVIGPQPLVNWEKREYRHHYSDPALLVDNGYLKLFYRDSLHKDKNDRIDKIYQLKSLDGVSWSRGKELRLPSRHFIAPSFLKEKDCIFVYYVVDEGDATRFYIGKYEGNGIYPISELNVQNAPTDMTIWHTDVKKYGVCYYVGLFTYMEKAGKGKTKMFYAFSKDGREWSIKHEIPLNCKRDISVYKATSCFVKNKIIVIASVEDEKYRWRIFNMGEITK